MTEAPAVKHDGKEKKHKKHKKRDREYATKTSTTAEMDRIPVAGPVENVHCISSETLAGLRPKNQLWLFSFPSGFPVNSPDFARTELIIPDNPDVSGGVIARFQLQSCEYEVFEDQSPEAVVNVVPNANQNELLLGRPFSRSFVIRKRVVVPEVDVAGLNVKQKVPQIVSSAKNREILDETLNRTLMSKELPVIPEQHGKKSRKSKSESSDRAEQLDVQNATDAGTVSGAKRKSREHRSSEKESKKKKKKDKAKRSDVGGS
ncbi:unnamed protein product (mitochondrion) [Plasmodiophora brassicae]|uniref:Uncharacterized protein n=1 Tax=Plasmodiophora brassicae TaxID=37360 RepID=A0A0G4J5G3_PLABS|nr:hypothetical protein PBRA_002714 [Plasmodiophora brassicae]SPQ94867.1 unnamed protein product [Plasmodiophora brassicae]